MLGVLKLFLATNIANCCTKKSGDGPWIGTVEGRLIEYKGGKKKGSVTVSLF